MELDARTLSTGTRLDADVCIVGAGPAGISLALEFIDGGATILLLESGGPELDEKAQELNEGPVVGDDSLSLRRSRRRQLGGSANLWNTRVGANPEAKYVPLDPWDFEERPDGRGRWPFDRSVLDPFYRRAQSVAGLGPFAYDAAAWEDAAHPRLPLADDRLVSGVYQFGPGPLFTRRYVDALRAAQNVRVCHHATLCRIAGEPGTRRVAEVTVASGPEGRFTVRAAFFVLAGGAVANARLLLLSGESVSIDPRSRDWVGRCFMEHPRDRALTLVPRDPELLAGVSFYDAHAAKGGHVIAGRLALQREAMREYDLPNASITLLPRLRQGAGGGGIVGWLRARLPFAAPPTTAYGWTRTPDPAAVYDALALLLNVEQRPDPENRLVLSSEHDALGLPRAELHWRWRPGEQAALQRLRSLVASVLEDAKLGRVEIDSEARPDPNAHHHAGTTRMSTEPGGGVVDPDGRVHGTDNLYAAGASLFPTAGFANPMLTIVALSLRLGDHLRTRL